MPQVSWSPFFTNSYLEREASIRPFWLVKFSFKSMLLMLLSDSVAQSAQVDTVPRQRKTHIALFLLLQLMGELGKCWSKTEWPKTEAHSQLLRDLQEIVPKGLHRSARVLGALVFWLCFPSVSSSENGWHCTVYFQGRFTRFDRKKNGQNESHQWFISSLLAARRRLCFIRGC